MPWPGVRARFALYALALTALGSLVCFYRLGDGMLVCEVEDDGYIDDALAGKRPPDPDSAGGRGLWMANQLCDLVQIRSAESGSVVRVQMRRVTAAPV